MTNNLLEMSQVMFLAIEEDVKINRGHAINWRNIELYYKLSEDFIEKFHNYLYMDSISHIQELSEKLIIKFINILDFNYIYVYQKLSEKFLIEMVTKYPCNKIHWGYICRNQKLSKEFIVEFIDKIEFEYIVDNDNIAQEIKDYCRMFI
jgi:hypothetical protein